MKQLRNVKAVFAFGLATLWSVLPALAEKPALVVSLRSIDDLIADADFVGEVLGNEGVKELAEATLTGLTGGAGLAGVDREKPLGLYWNFSGSEPGGFGTPVVFLPISDADAFKKLVSMFVPDLKAKDGQWSMSVQGQSLFAKIDDDYIYISTSKDGLADLSDPDQIVNSEYDIAIDVNLASIPKDAKATFLALTESEGRKGLENGPPPKSDAEAIGQKIGFEGTLAVLKSVANDGDRLTFGFDVDSETRLASLDLGLTGKRNSALTKSLAVYGSTAPALAAVVSKDAPLQLTLSFPTTGVIEQFDEFFEAVRKSAFAEIDKDKKLEDDADKKAAKDVAKRLLNIAQATIKSGSSHSVVVLDEGDDDTIVIFGGTKLAKGEDAGKLLDDILKLAKESPELAKVKPDVAKHAGARIHAIDGDMNDKQEALFGKDPGHLAIRPDSMWFAIGGGNLEALKTALDLSGKKPEKTDVPMSLRLKPAMIVTLFEKDDEALIKRAKSLAGEAFDVLNIEIVPTESKGIELHVEFGVDLIKLGVNK